MGLEADCMAIGIAANLPRCAPVLPGIPLALAFVVPALGPAFAKVAAGSMLAPAFDLAIDLANAAIAKVSALVPTHFLAALAKAPAPLDRVANFPADAFGVSAALLDQLVAVNSMSRKPGGGSCPRGHDYTGRQRQ